MIKRSTYNCRYINKCVCVCVHMYIHTHTHTQTPFSNRQKHPDSLLTNRNMSSIYICVKSTLKETWISTKKFTFTGNEITCQNTMDLIQQLLIRRYIHFLMFSCKDYLLKQSSESKASISWQRAGEKKDGSDQRDKRVPLSIFLSDFSKIV